MSASAYGWLHRAWYERAPGYQLLLPLTLLYASVVTLRRLLYRLGVLRSESLPVPVVVVGNLVAGGAGKTPVTLFLAESLKARGFRPGIVSRGYGRRSEDVIVDVSADSTANDVGDEPLLLARRSGCPVVVGSDRVAAAKRLLANDVDVIIADDGLQHYRLRRDVEICVVDAERGFGNGWQIPAGPLREPLSRLESVDAVLLNGDKDSAHASVGEIDVPVMPFTLAPGKARRLDGSQSRALSDFSGTLVHAFAGIGNPSRFFRMLESFGIEVVPHPLRDHAAVSMSELDVGDASEVLMTEKDAVKLPSSGEARLWAVPVALTMDSGLADSLLDSIEARCRKQQEMET